jgi:hypothetical protein
VPGRRQLRNAAAAASAVRSTAPEVRTNASRTATARNDAASASTTPVRPVSAYNPPPRAGPTSRARLLFQALSEFAAIRSSDGTRRGRNAFSAGSENWESVADTRITG